MRNTAGNVFALSTTNTALAWLFCHFLTPRLSLLFLLAGNGLCRAFAGTRIGVGTLATHRQITAMPQSPQTTKVQIALDIHRRLAAKVTFNQEIRVDNVTQFCQLVFR
jgi:hypothetical protein